MVRVWLFNDKRFCLLCHWKAALSLLSMPFFCNHCSNAPYTWQHIPQPRSFISMFDGTEWYIQHVIFHLAGMCFIWQQSPSPSPSLLRNDTSVIHFWRFLCLSVDHDASIAGVWLKIGDSLKGNYDCLFPWDFFLEVLYCLAQGLLHMIKCECFAFRTCICV